MITPGAAQVSPAFTTLQTPCGSGPRPSDGTGRDGPCCPSQMSPAPDRIYPASWRAHRVCRPSDALRGTMETVDLTCQQLVELVTDYLENALTEEERWRFLAHLDGCLGCQIHLDQTRNAT